MVSLLPLTEGESEQMFLPNSESFETKMAEEVFPSSFHPRFPGPASVRRNEGLRITIFTTVQNIPNSLLLCTLLENVTFVPKAMSSLIWTVLPIAQIDIVRRKVNVQLFPNQNLCPLLFNLFFLFLAG